MMDERIDILRRGLRNEYDYYKSLFDGMGTGGEFLNYVDRFQDYDISNSPDWQVEVQAIRLEEKNRYMDFIEEKRGVSDLKHDGNSQEK